MPNETPKGHGLLCHGEENRESSAPSHVWYRWVDTTSESRTW
jgi:hypothetical protein